MKTNEQIFEEIKTRGYISEQQIRLLKRRGNHQNEDVFDYSLFDAGQFEYGVPLTPEQNEKGIKFLRDLTYTPTGKTRKNCPFGYRELNIISTSSEFRFKGFYDAGRRGYVSLLPLYELDGMEYYYDGEVHVVG